MAAPTESGAQSAPASDSPVVFSLASETLCAECDRELGRGNLMRKEGGQALCLSCADLDHLEFLPAGDPALTRRAMKHSRLRFVVVRWSRARKRYERQGILVEPQAIERAEEECLADADLRQARGLREAARREGVDREYVAEFARRIRARYPGCPGGQETRIAEHACRKHSGRVGRTAAAKDFAPEAIDLAVAAHVRHTHSPYDELLARGRERQEARRMVADRIEAVLAEWRGRAGMTGPQ